MLTKPKTAIAIFSKNLLLASLVCATFFSFTTTAHAQEKRSPEQIAVQKFQAIKTLKDLAHLLDLPDTAEVQSFIITYHKRDTDPTTYENATGALETNTERMITWATAGDTYYFDKLMLKEGETVRKTAVVCRIVE